LEEEGKSLSENVDANFICKIAISEKKLNLGQHHDSLSILKEVQDQLRALSDVDPRVYSSLFKALATLFRRKNDHEEFYKNALQFLAYTPKEDMTKEEQKDWCVRMGMSVLLGKNIYNISELVRKFG